MLSEATDKIQLGATSDQKGWEQVQTRKSVSVQLRRARKKSVLF